MARVRHLSPGRLGRPDEKVAKATQRPTRDDLMWAAGFLEGEGTFQPNSGSGSVNATQVNPEPVERLQRIFGGHLSRVRNRTRGRAKGRDWSDAVNWHTSGPRARGIMLTLYVLLSVKRRAQIRRALGRD